tara:strand:+ start:311 stop:766 length:456 start_codon:yes stop_codon:yes gene_type:complete
MLRTLLIALSLAVGPYNAAASDEQVQSAKLIWPAWQCSTLAVHAGRKDEVARLFNAGFSSALTVIQAAFGGTLSKDAIEVLPIGISWNLWGPSPEFSAGYVFAVIESETKTLIEDRAERQEDELLAEYTNRRRVVAEMMFDEANCDLISQR